MAVSTISLRPAVTSGNLDGTARMLVDDKNGNTRKSTLAMLRTNMFAGSTGFTAADPLVAGPIVSVNSGQGFTALVPAAALNYFYSDSLTNNASGKRWRFGYTGSASGSVSSFDFHNETDNVTAVTITAAGAMTVARSITTTATGAAIIATGGDTSARWMEIENASGDAIFGLESSTGGTLITGAPGYSAVVRGGGFIAFSANGGTLHGSISSAGAWFIPGNLTVGGTLAATGITIPGTALTGTVLASGIVTTSITTVGILASPHMTSPVVDSGGVTVTLGGVTISAGGLTVSAGGASITGTTSVTGAFTVTSGSVGIGGTPNANAILDVQSTTKGLMLPRMTTTQRNSIGVNGMVVYDTDLDTFFMFKGGSWAAF